MEQETKRLNVPIERALHKRIRMAAAASEMSVPALLKEIIVSGLARIEGQTVKSGKAA